LKHPIAPIAPNTARVYRHVPLERILAGQNLFADIAGRRVAQVFLIMVNSLLAFFERNVANAAKIAPI
jgi:hypothetical protein